MVLIFSTSIDFPKRCFCSSCLSLLVYWLIILVGPSFFFFPFEDAFLLAHLDFPFFLNYLRGRKCLSPSSERATILRGFRNRLLSSPVKSQQAVIYPDVNKPRPLLPSQRAGKTESPLARSCFILLFEEGVKGGESWEDFLKGGGGDGERKG